MGTGGVTGTAAGGLYASDSILAFNISGANSTDLSTLSTAIDTAIKSVTTAGATLGAVSTNITNQSSFVSSLSDAITSGVCFAGWMPT